MRFLSAAPLLALVPAVFGQNTTVLTDLLQALTSSGLTRLSSIAAQLNSTTAGQSLLSQLSSGASFVLFAPTDNAFNSASSNITSDADILSSVIAYHVVQGNFTGISTTYPNTTVGRTLLNNSTLVQLEGNKNQVVAWAARADGKVHVLNQRNDSIVSNTTTVGNITINIVDHVLNIPQSLAVTVPADNVSLAGIDTALKSVQLSTNQSGSAAFFDILNTQLHGFTFFAPNTSAVQAAASSLSSLQSNTTALQALFQNHLINGSTVYSPELSGQNFTSAAGEPLSFVLNATGHFVTSGNVTAQIVQPDVLLPNGVLHVIDRVLLNTQVDSGAASSAASSASSVATQSTSATAPIGFPATATLTGPGGSAPAASGSGGSGNAAAGGYLVPSMAQVVSVGVAVLGVVAGGRLVLA